MHQSKMLKSRLCEARKKETNNILLSIFSKKRDALSFYSVIHPISVLLPASFPHYSSSAAVSYLLPPCLQLIGDSHLVTCHGTVKAHRGMPLRALK